jgi:FeS assembly SUF system protein
MRTKRWIREETAMKTENKQSQLLKLEAEIVNVLKTIFDPEIPVNIYDLGLVYDIVVEEETKVRIVMTLTAPNCPIADQLLLDVKQRVTEIEGVTEAEVELVFDPPWDQNMMSEEALLELGMM